MKKITIYKIVSIVCFFLITSVPSIQAQQKVTKPIEVVSAEIYQKGEDLFLTMELDLHRLKPGTQQEIVLTPVLVGGENRAVLPEIVVYGKNRYKVNKRSMALQKKQPDLEKTAYQVLKSKKDLKKRVVYTQTLPYEDWMKNSSLIIEGDLCGCGKWEPLTEYKVAERVSYDFQPELAYIQPDFEAVKKRREDTEVFIDFKVNQFTIQPELMNNKMELDKLNKALEQVQTDKNLTVNQIDIIGYASPEGNVSVNENLSKRRAEELKKYLSTQAYFPAEVYQVKYGGENWTGLEVQIENSSFENKKEVQNILQNTPEVAMRKELLKKMNNGKTYRYMLTEFYPKLRKTVVDIHYDIRNFSVEEGKEILKTYPGQLSLNELFQIAKSYPIGSEEFVEVFNTAVVLYPQSRITNLNAAAAALSVDDLDTAKAYLDKADKDSKEYLNNMGAYYYLSGDFDRAQGYFSQAAQKGSKEAQVNITELKNKNELEKVTLQR